MTTAQRMENEFAGPIIFNYVWWILHEAMARKIDRLYFLARDGYILLKIAKAFCTKFGLNIDCRYLVCSRASLRLPCYSRIGNEAYNLLLSGGYYATLTSLLQRLPIDEIQMREICVECGLDNMDSEKALSKQEFQDVCSKLRLSKAYMYYMKEASEEAYENTIAFLCQEGLFEKENIAIVDSGWTGSMQRSLRQLLQSAGFTGTITGFYFGLYTAQKNEDGTYLTWFFDSTSKTMDKVHFNNNLFEGLLRAPYGMAVSYQEKNGRYEPVLTAPPDEKEIDIINQQIEAILSYAKQRLKKTEFMHFIKVKKALKRDTRKRLKRYMVYPRRAEAEFYGGILFCDDITEKYQLQLASKKQIPAVQDYLLLPRIRNRIKKLSRTALLWPCGTVAFLPVWKQPWYRLNICSWEWLKYSMAKRKILSARNLFKHYKKKIDNCDVVSFDVFDTLLYRIVSKPTEVFRLMEPEIERRYQIRDYYHIRIQAEQCARKLSGNEDVTIQEIYEAMRVGTWDKNEVIRFENETEFSVLMPDTFMSEIFKYCVRCGKQTIIITDMYQSHEFITDALERNGIDGYSALYVSSAVKKTKASGTLFRYIAEHENISDKEHWLHIGDNKRSDYLIPRRYGLKTLLYRRREI